MRVLILLCAATFFAGCAHQDEYDSGRPGNRTGFDTGTHLDTELPYRAGPGQNRTDRELPQRSGPGGYGLPY